MSGFVLTTQRDDDDYDIDFYTVDPIPTEMHDVTGVSLSPREQYEVRLQ